MHQVLNFTGSTTAAIGILLCAISGLARISGFYYLAGYQSTTIFSVGTGLMVFACLIRLQTILAQLNQK
jgi:hypothetical protein